MQSGIKLSLAITCLSSLVWAQSNQPSQRPQNPTNSANSDSTGQGSTELKPGDSVKLEIVKSQEAIYPPEARRQGIQGQVILKVLISENGDVETAEVVSGDPMLAESALDAVKKFKFKPFIRDGKVVKVSTKLPFDFYFKEKMMEEGVSADRSATSNSKGLGPSPPMATPAPSAGGVSLAPPDRVRVSAGVTQGLLIHQVAPVYPQEARNSRIEGVVVLQAVIGKDGRIKDLTLLSGRKELASAAIAAVQQWRYKPYLLAGSPIEVQTTITVKFNLR